MQELKLTKYKQEQKHEIKGEKERGKPMLELIEELEIHKLESQNTKTQT